MPIILDKGAQVETWETDHLPLAPDGLKVDLAIEGSKELVSQLIVEHAWTLADFYKSTLVIGQGTDRNKSSLGFFGNVFRAE